MEDKVQWSRNVGVLEVRQDGSKHCVACDRTVPEPELQPHFKGKDHLNNLVWYIMQSPSPSQPLLDLLPSVVQAAKRSNEVELVDKASFSFRCLVCPKKLPFNGIKPLEAHLAGKEHKKQRNMSSSLTFPQPSASNLAPPQATPSHLHHQPPQPQPQPAIPPQLQPTPPPHPQPALPLQPRPTPPAQPQLAIPHQPLPTPPLQSQAALPPQPRPTPPVQPQPTPSPATSHHIYLQSSQSNYNGTAQPQYSPAPQAQCIPAPPTLQQVPSQPSTNNTGATALQPDGSSPDVDHALATGVVVSTSATSYRCVVCNRDFNGPAPLQEHLRSEKHKRKAQLQRDFSNMSIDGNPRTQPRTPDSMVFGQGREDLADAPWTLPWTIVPSRSYQQPSETVYCNLSMPRGLVLVFNYYFTGSHNERRGARRDSFNIQTLFRRMGYLVYLYEDLSKAETKEMLQKNRDSPFLKNYDSLIVFVMSHGKDDKYFSTRDDACMTLDDVRYCFTDTDCPALTGKPKLFFVNFCRGSLQEPQIQYDSIGLQHAAPKDMVTMYACISGYQAPRDPETGTLFVQVWCEVLAAHAHHMELQELHSKVCNLVVSRGGATSENQGYHFTKKFYFNPT